MPQKTVIFLGSKPVGHQCFAYLLAQQEQLNIRVVGLLTQPRSEFGTSDLAALAAERHIPVFSHPDEMPPCDIMYSVQYHLILKKEHIEKAGIAVNLHMAPLPEYRGSNQFSFAILDQKSEFGTTIHKMDVGIDSGDILFQKRFPIPEGCWVSELYQLTFKASVNLFKQTLAHIVSGNFTPVPQAALENKYGTSLHYRKEMAHIKEIDLNWDADKIESHIRATSMPGFEPPYCFVNGVKVFFSVKGSQ